MTLKGKDSFTLPRPALRGRGSFLWRPACWLLVTLAVATLAYLPGLKGPFLFDDPPNIILPISAWLNGHTGWQEVVFGNDSGLLHRPLANLTFALNAAISGLQPLPFKVTNLAIHLLGGLAIYALLVRLLPRDPMLGSRAKLIALVVAAIWLLHPIQVSTVLYVVQRMAQMSALFMLLALIAFVLGRIALEDHRSRVGFAWLFIAVPLATIAAVLSKENGALVPLLCAVIELGYFRATVSLPRPSVVKIFFVVSLLLPALAATLWYATHFEGLLARYDLRLFSLGERLLTQPRVLMDYMGALVMPRGPSLGIYTDDFVVSQGLLDPPGTLLAIFALVALMVAAMIARARAPAVFTGIGLYLAGHVMEGSIFPLEMYFEHRNYLPSFGLFLALAGLCAWVGPKVLERSDDPARLRKMLAGALVLLLAMLFAATFARAGIWSSWPLLAAQGVRQHPQSMRAHLDHANMLQLQGRHAEARQVFDYMTTMDNPAARHAGIIDTVSLECMAHGRTTREAVNRISTIAGSKLQLAEMLALENLANYLHENECKYLDKTKLADLIVEIVNGAPQPEKLTQLWRSRFVASRLYAAGGHLLLARQQAALAWMTGAADNAVGIYLVHLYLATGDAESAALIFQDVEQRISTWDRRNQRLANQLNEQLKLREAAPDTRH